MKRKILGLLLVLCMVLSLLPAAAFATETETTPVAAGPISVAFQNSSSAIVKWENVPVGTTKYATNDEKGLVSELNANADGSEPSGWTIKLENTAEGATLTLKDATITRSGKTSSAAVFDIVQKYQGNITAKGDGALKIVAEGTTTLSYGSYFAIAAHMQGGTTVTGDGLLKINQEGTGVSGFFYVVGGSLTFVDAKNVEMSIKKSVNNGLIHIINSEFDLILDNSIVAISYLPFEKYPTKANGIKTGGDLIIRNNSKLTIHNQETATGGTYGIHAGAGIKLDNTSALEVYQEGDSWTSLINVMPVALDENKAIVGYHYATNGAEPVEITADTVFPLTGYKVSYAPASAPSAPAECNHVGTTITTSEEVTLAATCGVNGTKTVTSTCECGKVTKVEEGVVIPATGEHNYGEQVNGVKTCATCGATTSGCTHTNAPAQTNCTEAVICPDCGATVIAAKEHKFTDDKDTTCDNEGCKHTRVIENPATGDTFSVVLVATLALASLATLAVTVIGKKRAI